MTRNNRHENPIRIDYQTIVWLLNQLPDDDEKSSKPRKRKRRHQHKPDPKQHRKYEPEVGPELDPSLESAIESRFDPDEAYEESATPAYRNKDL